VKEAQVAVQAKATEQQRKENKKPEASK